MGDLLADGIYMKGTKDTNHPSFTPTMQPYENTAMGEIAEVCPLMMPVACNGFWLTMS
jgi:hypothetical protein